MVVGASPPVAAARPRVPVPLTAAVLAAAACVLLWTFLTVEPPAGFPHLFDFHTFWAAGRDYLHGRDPYPRRIEGPVRTAEAFVYPAPVAAAIVPLALLPYSVAWVVFAAALVAAAVGALWLLGVRDVRCYAVAFCTVPVLKAVNLGTVTPLLLLGVALLWRYRDRTGPAAAAAAVVVVTKLFLWPILPWLWFSGRRRAAALAALGAAAATVLAWLPLGASSLEHYPALVHQLASAEGPAGYGSAGIATALGASAGTAARISLAAAALVLVAVARAGSRLDDDASLALATTAAIVASPVAWEHYFALLFAVVALRARTWSWRWLVPLGYWAIPDGQAWGSPWRCAVAAALAALCAVPSRRLVPVGAIRARRARLEPCPACERAIRPPTSS